VKWALDHRGDLVGADAVGAYSFGLRCPSCREPVFARPGSVREAHFAHRSGNANKECDDYHPGSGSGSGSGWLQVSRPHARSSKERLGSPALIWRADEALAAGLFLRLPTHPEGFSSTVRVVSFATSQHGGETMTRPRFIRLRLQASPAEVKTLPRDELLEQAIAETLDHFRWTGNFFRANGEGGVLVPRDWPLELGETYWLLTQSPPNLAHCSFVRVDEHRADRAWHAYRLVLTYDGADAEDAIQEVAACLSRTVVKRRPSTKIVWPLPARRDPDGVRVYDREVKNILVRSREGQPHWRSHGNRSGVSELLEGDLYQIPIDTESGEAVLGVPGGLWERVRFEDCELGEPSGVTLICDRDQAALHGTDASALMAKELTIQVEVPAHRLWPSVLVNGNPIRPVPDGLTHVIPGLTSSVSAGAFGSAVRPIATAAASLPWWVEVEPSVRRLKGDRAAGQLHRVEGTAQLLRYVLEHQSQFLLPKLMLAIGRGVRQ
jgi:hypothetical protein